MAEDRHEPASSRRFSSEKVECLLQFSAETDSCCDSSVLRTEIGIPFQRSDARFTKHLTIYHKIILSLSQDRLTC